MAVDDTRTGGNGGGAGGGGADQQTDAAAAAAAAKRPAAPLCSREQMQQYYARLFPAQQMHRWLAYGNDSSLPGADPAFSSRREICFTLEGDIFARYQSFPVRMRERDIGR